MKHFLQNYRRHSSILTNFMLSHVYHFLFLASGLFTELWWSFFYSPLPLLFNHQLVPLKSPDIVLMSLLCVKAQY